MPGSLRATFCLLTAWKEGWFIARYSWRMAALANVSLRFDRFDHHELAHAATVFKHNSSANLCEQSVVFAAANVQAWLHAGAALTHDNRATGHHLSAECFESETLRVGIASVS